MFDFTTMPLTPEDLRGARNYLGLSQAKAAEESGLPAHKIKRFELGNYIPDVKFLTELRAFLEERGYQFQGTQKPGAKARETGQVFPAGVVGETVENQGVPGRSSLQRAAFHHMRIAITNEAEMGRMLDLIEHNEEHAAELLRRPIGLGLFGGLSDETRAGHAQALSLLAENGAMFARLFGRDLGGKPSPAVLDGSKRPETLAELLHRAHADVHRAIAGDREARERKKSKSLADSVLEAIGLS